MEHKIVYTARQIQRRIETLGNELRSFVHKVISETGQPPLFLCVLRGGCFFFCDLVRELPITIELDFCRTKFYTGQNQNKIVELNLDHIDVKDRTVVLVDDIVDSGLTATALIHKVRSNGARDVKVITLIYREKAEGYKPDWYGFAYKGDSWFGGYGMDFDNIFRNTNDVYILVKE